MKQIKNKLLGILLLIFISVGLFAQERVITGLVSDFRGKPVAGANVCVKEIPTISTLSGADGYFKLNVPKTAKVLEFSISGMITKQVELSQLNHINIEMNYAAGKNPYPWSILANMQIYESDVYNKSKLADTSWVCSGAPGISLTLELEYFPFQKFGFSFGIGISSYSSKAWLNNFNNYQQNTVQMTDKDNDTYYLYNTVSTLNEQTFVKSICFPVKMKYRMRPGKKLDFIFEGGLKFLYIKSATVRADGQSSWQGYYPEYHVVLYDLPEYGFTSYTINSENEIKDFSKLMLSLTAKAGISLAMGKRMSFDFGVFYEQGITDLNYYEPTHEADFLTTIGTKDETILRSLGVVAGLRFVLAK